MTNNYYKVPIKYIIGFKEEKIDLLELVYGKNKDKNKDKLKKELTINSKEYEKNYIEEIKKNKTNYDFYDTDNNSFDINNFTYNNKKIKEIKEIKAVNKKTNVSIKLNINIFLIVNTLIHNFDNINIFYENTDITKIFNIEENIKNFNEKLPDFLYYTFSNNIYKVPIKFFIGFIEKKTINLLNLIKKGEIIKVDKKEDDEEEEEEEIEEIEEIEEKKEEDKKEDDEEEEEEMIYGGKIENSIELNDIFKLYYSYLILEGNDEDISNIYKLYFIINIYGNYYKENREKYELIENLKGILELGNYNEEMIDTIKRIIIEIYKNTNEIYEEYIKEFDEIDKIIKNICETEEIILKYLNINFIYELYKNYEKKDINIKIDVKGNIIKVRKSLEEIKEEIDKIYKNGDSIFEKKEKKINKKEIYDNEIDNLIKFIYDITKEGEIEKKYDNMNDLNTIIIINLLSNEEEEIKIRINGEEYKIKNIKNHPYKIIERYDKIEIRLNEIQLELYKKILEEKSKLLRILGKEYYYINFDIYKTSKFKYHINNEIISMISKEDYEKRKRSIINYNSYKMMRINEIEDISILSKEKIRLIFLINYGIIIGSSIFTEININNFITLIYIYLIIKNNTKEYLNLINYKGEKREIKEYREYIKSINILSYLKSILNLMRIKINLRMDLRNFIKRIINFGENNIINNLKKTLKINIDINFIQNLFILTSYEIDDKFKQNYYKSFLLVYNNCIKGKDNIINLLYIFIIPSLKFLSNNDINVINIEKEILDIKAKELLKFFFNQKKIGGEGNEGNEGKEDNEQKPNLPLIDIEKAKKELKENAIKKQKGDIKYISTTDLSDNSKEILKYMEVFNQFYINFSKLNFDLLIKSFEKIIDDYFLIYEDKAEKIFITSSDKSKLFEDYKEIDIFNEFQKKIITIKSNIANNKRNLEDTLKLYQFYNELKENKPMSDRAKELNKVLKDIENMKLNLIDLKKFKDKSREVKNLLEEFYPNDDDKIPLMDKINDFIEIYKKKFDLFIHILGDVIKKYELLEKEIIEYFNKATTFQDDKQKIRQADKDEERKELNQKKKDIKTKIKKYDDEIEQFNNELENLKTEINELNIKIKSATNEEDKKKLENDLSIKKQNEENLNSKIKNVETLKLKIEEQLKNIKIGGASNIEAIKNDNKTINELFKKDNLNFDENGEKINYENRFNDIKKRFDNIKKDYKKLKVSTYIPNSIDKDIIINDFIDKNGDTLFERMLNEYALDAKDKNQEIAKANFYNKVENYNLDPEKELEITFIDKLIFAFLVIFLRYAGLYITYRFIDNKFIKSIKEAIIYYSISYVIVLFLFVIIVNIDLFRLRIVFNYCNLHINSTGILSHMIIKIIIGYIIYLLIINLDNEAIPTYLSKNQKIKLKKKLDILTMIVLIFLIIFVLII